MTYPVSATEPRMGRPPMNVKPMLVRLPDGMDKRIDAVLEAKEKRADLIRKAVELEISRRSRLANRGKTPKDSVKPTE